MVDTDITKNKYAIFIMKGLLYGWLELGNPCSFEARGNNFVYLMPTLLQLAYIGHIHIQHNAHINGGTETLITLNTDPGRVAEMVLIYGY